jgi:hypothetical protein
LAGFETWPILNGDASGLPQGVETFTHLEVWAQGVRWAYAERPDIDEVLLRVHRDPVGDVRESEGVDIGNLLPVTLSHANSSE